MPYRRLLAIPMLLLGVAACSTVTPPAPPPAPPTVAVVPDTPTPAPTLVPSATPVSCETLPGKLQQGSVPETKPSQEYIIYLPPCYDEHVDERYPILYLLHGQTFTDQQWVALGAPQAADSLIHSGQAPPFIIVFPDDRYWNLPPGDGFGDRLVHQIVPYIDQTYRTLKDRDHRALGGLSRGGGWAIHILLTRYDLFGTIGLHSPVILNDDLAVLQRLVAAVPANAWPRLWLDAGDHDGGLGTIRMFEAMLTQYEAPHEWHLYSGDHTDPYWQSHVSQYLQWYAEGFRATSADTVDPAATP
jgi:enterochelin esterase-like enzyme